MAPRCTSYFIKPDRDSRRGFEKKLDLRGGKDSTALLLLLLQKLRDVFRSLWENLTGAERRRAQSAEGKLSAVLDAAATQAQSLLEAPEGQTGEMNTHEYSFPICDLLRETEAREWFAPAEPEPPEKPSVRQQLQAAMKEARQHLSQEAKTHGGDAR